MRITWTLVLPLALAACSSNWQAYQIDTACRKVPYFLDADDDGWGDPADPGTLACNGGPNTARNNRDCNDDATSGHDITGRIGSLCPSELVAQDGPTQFAPVISGSEFVVVDGSTSLVWAGAAAEACGTYGWGGHLATFQNVNQLKAVLAALGDQQVYAGFVGFSPTEHTWGEYGSDGSWVVDSTAGPFQVPLCACVADGADQATCADKYLNSGDTGTPTSDLRYLALIRHRVGGATSNEDNWCVGTPDEAYEPTLPSDTATPAHDPDYQRLYGHFICARDIPDPANYALGALPGTDTATQ